MRNNEQQMHEGEFAAAKADGILREKPNGVLGNEKQD